MQLTIIFLSVIGDRSPAYPEVYSQSSPNLMDSYINPGS